MKVSGNSYDVMVQYMKTMLNPPFPVVSATGIFVPQKCTPGNYEINESAADNLAPAVVGIINGAFDSGAYTLWLKQ
jgi:hypothetical protein